MSIVKTAEVTAQMNSTMNIKWLNSKRFEIFMWTTSETLLTVHMQVYHECDGKVFLQ